MELLYLFIFFFILYWGYAWKETLKADYWLFQGGPSSLWAFFMLPIGSWLLIVIVFSSICTILYASASRSKRSFEKKFQGGSIIFDWLIKNGYLEEKFEREGYLKVITSSQKEDLKKEYPDNFTEILNFINYSTERQFFLILSVFYLTFIVLFLFIHCISIGINQYYSSSSNHSYLLLLNVKNIDSIIPHFWVKLTLSINSALCGVAGFVKWQNQNKSTK